MKRYFFLIGLFALPMLFAGHSAQAATPCELKEQVTAFTEAKNSSNGSNEAVKTELQARKDLLLKIVDCGEAEVKTLQGTVKEISSKDKDILKIRDRFVADLNDVGSFYASERSRIDSLGLRGSRDMARNMKEWRVLTYVPLAEETANLVIWIRNQDLFGTAQNRFGQISQTIRTLSLEDEEDIQALLKEAEAKLKEATALNAAAKEALLTATPPAETTVIIKESLQALSDTYKNFFALSDATKKLLPL